MVERIRARWPGVRMMVRGDSGFCRDRIKAWFEREEGIRYVFGLARNLRLQRGITEDLEAAKAACAGTGEVSRSVREPCSRTLDSWSCERRVVGWAEWLPGPRGSNPRFVVTDIHAEELGARVLYEELDFTRGEMESRIKERQTDPFADRTSAHGVRASQLRACFSALAGVVIEIIRRFGLTGTELERAQAGTIRGKLLKIAGSIRVTTCRVRVSLSSTYCWQSLFRRVARRLVATRRLHSAPEWLPPACLEELRLPGHGELRPGASTRNQRERSRGPAPAASTASTPPRRDAVRRPTGPRREIPSIPRSRPPAGGSQAVSGEPAGRRPLRQVRGRSTCRRFSRQRVAAVTAGPSGPPLPSRTGSRHSCHVPTLVRAASLCQRRGSTLPLARRGRAPRGTLADGRDGGRDAGHTGSEG